jgi:hypothetical protein
MTLMARSGMLATNMWLLCCAGADVLEAEANCGAMLRFGGSHGLLILYVVLLDVTWPRISCEGLVCQGAAGCRRTMAIGEASFAVPGCDRDSA